MAVEYQKEYLKASSVFTDVKCLRLQADSHEAIIGSVDRVLLSENRAYVMDRKGNKVIAYDGNGRFVSSTSSLTGSGRNEYIRVFDAAIDNENGQVLVYCDAPYQIMVFDLDLKLLSCQKVDCLINEFIVDNQYLYALCQNEKEWDQYELRRYNRHNLTEKYKVLLKQDKAITSVNSFGKSLSGDGQIGMISMPFDNVIYKIHDGEISESWKLDFNGTWFSYSDSKNLQGNRFIDYNKNYNWIIQNICVSDSFILFNTNKSPVFLMDIKEEQVKAYPELINDIYPFSNTWLIPNVGRSKIVVSEIPSNVVVRYLDYVKEHKEALVDQNFIDLLIGYSEDDNPILMLCEMK